jgi:N4-gp56 family major capsid protein
MLNYNAPTLTPGGTASDIDAGGGNQLETFFYLKKAIIRARLEQFFMPLASVANMPKNFGKTIKVFEYVPLLDARNVNDQGLDASGASYANGNLYGSSRDIGTITSRLPLLAEDGGRVNRVGFTRLVRTGTLVKFGFFTEFSNEALQFDSDAELMDHLATELMNGAVQLTEAVLQKDLLAAAGVLLYSGSAVSRVTCSAEGGADVAAIVNYKNFVRLDQSLTNNRTPRQTKVITGSRMIDTKTLPACRVVYVGIETAPVLKAMVDLFGNAAFIPVQRYADAGTILNGEIGSIDLFRIVQVQEMLNWAGGGAAVVTNPGYRATGANYDVFPILCVGDDSFATIGFQTDGETLKFSVLTKMPGREMATTSDPYGETGFSSIKWYYGILIKRAERIGIIHTVCPV